MATGDKIYLNTNRGLYFSIFLFLIIIGVTVYFYYQNNYILEEKINSSAEELTKKEKILKDLNEQKEVQVYHLLKANSKTFEIKEKLSNIPVLIEKINALQSEYKIAFEQFSYNNGKISLNAVAYDSDGLKAYEKIENFIGYFRTKNTKEKNIKKREFNLDFVKVFNGKDSSNIKFKVNLEIDPKNYTIEKAVNSEEQNNIKQNIDNNSSFNKDKIKEKLKKIKQKNKQEEEKK